MAVERICRRLDGLPLALELAAAWVSVLPAESIAQRLEDPLRLLIRGDATGEERHRSLRTAMDWSHDLLSPDQRLLFRRLAVCAGGWDLETAEALSVIGGSERAGARDAALDLLARLVEQSLVLLDAAEGEARYRMLETVRQYAHEQLEASGETEIARLCHARHFLALSEQAAADLAGAAQAVWLQRLERELDNLRAALAFWLETGAAEPAQRLATSLSRFWEVHAHLEEGRRGLDAALACEGPVDASLRARTLNAAGSIARIQGQWAHAAGRLSAALAAEREAGNPEGVARALINLGILAGVRGDWPQAGARFDESLALYRSRGNESGVSTALHLLGIVRFKRGEHEASLARYERALTIRRKLGDRNGIAKTLGNMGNVARAKRDYARAAELHREALERAREVGDRLAVAESLVGMAEVFAARGAGKEGTELVAAASAIRDAAGAVLQPSDRPEFDYTLELCRRRLSDAEFARAWAEGAALSIDQAITRAQAVPQPNIVPGEISIPGTVSDPPTGAEQPVASPTLDAESLTRRERELLHLLARGQSNKTIARELLISVRTVERHLANLYEKLDPHSRGEVQALLAALGSPSP